MPALETVADYVEEARRLLQDEDGVARYPDTDILQALSIGLLEARRLRPDLFYPFQAAIPMFTAVDATVVNIEPMFRPAFVYYIVGRMELRDSEPDKDARASALLNKFVAQMLSITS